MGHHGNIITNNHPKPHPSSKKYKKTCLTQTESGNSKKKGKKINVTETGGTGVCGFVVTGDVLLCLHLQAGPGP
jgi:hypothetical protein